MKGTILVTGATGALGRAFVGMARQAGLSLRQGVRDPAKANPDVEAVRMDYDDASTFAPALSGAQGLLLIAPPLQANAAEQLRPMVAEARAAGVQHVVFISALGANQSEQSPLRVIEHLVMDSGIPYTILRPNFFMENFSSGFLVGSIRQQGAIYLAAGDAKTSFITVADIAAVAVTAFQNHLTGTEFDLTGPEALDHAEVALMISEASGRPVVYHALTEEQMTAGARAAGMPESAVAYLTALYGLVRAGLAAGINGEVERVTGRLATRFADFARNAAQAWKS